MNATALRTLRRQGWTATAQVLDAEPQEASRRARFLLSLPVHPYAPPPPAVTRALRAIARCGNAR